MQFWFHGLWNRAKAHIVCDLVASCDVGRLWRLAVCCCAFQLLEVFELENVRLTCWKYFNFLELVEASGKFETCKTLELGCAEKCSVIAEAAS